MPPTHRRRPRVAGRVPAGTTPRASDERDRDVRAEEPEADGGPGRTAPTRRSSRPRGVAAVLPPRARPTEAPEKAEAPEQAEAPEVVEEAPEALAADEPPAADDHTDGGGAPGKGSFLDRLPVATTRKATVLVAAVAVLLFGAAAFLGVSWWRTAHSAAAENTALVDVATTAQVSQQLGDAVKKVYSFDYTRLDQNEKAARDVITPDFQAAYDTLFEQVRTLGTQQQAVVTATISQIAVREVHGDTAVAVVFVDQQATRAAASDGQTQAASAGRLTVTGKLVDGVWKIADVQVL
jgi:Mce-associated membrane protein